MRGDILFWPASNSISDRIITKVTDGPFVHVAVDTGHGTEISAHSEDGVANRPLISSGLTVWNTFGNLPVNLYDEKDYHDAVERGMIFLQGQISKKYDYLMPLNSFFRRVGVPLRIYSVSRYDCSVLVAHYLEHVGIDLSDDDEAVSPNDIARALGVLKK